MSKYEISKEKQTLKEKRRQRGMEEREVGWDNNSCITQSNRDQNLKICQDWKKRLRPNRAKHSFLKNHKYDVMDPSWISHRDVSLVANS